MNNQIGIGWCTFGEERSKNYLAVAISEKGENDIELLTSNKISSTTDIVDYVYSYINEVAKLHPGFSIVLSVFSQGTSLPTTLLKEIEKKIFNEDGSIAIKAIISIDDCSPNNGSYHDVEKIYQWHFNLSNQEYQTGLAALLAIRHGMGLHSGIQE